MLLLSVLLLLASLSRLHGLSFKVSASRLFSHLALNKSNSHSASIKPSAIQQPFSQQQPSSHLATQPAIQPFSQQQPSIQAASRPSNQHHTASLSSQSVAILPPLSHSRVYQPQQPASSQPTSQPPSSPSGNSENLKIFQKSRKSDADQNADQNVNQNADQNRHILKMSRTKHPFSPKVQRTKIRTKMAHSGPKILALFLSIKNGGWSLVR